MSIPRLSPLLEFLSRSISCRADLGSRRESRATSLQIQSREFVFPLIPAMAGPAGREISSELTRWGGQPSLPSHAGPEAAHTAWLLQQEALFETSLSWTKVV